MNDAELPLVWYATDQPDDALMSRLTETPAQVAVCGLLDEPPDGDALVIDAESDPVAALRLCRATRRKYVDDGPPIMVLTRDEKSYRLPAYQAGADVCLRRPFDNEELLAQLRASLRWSSNHRRENDRSDRVREANRELQQAYAQMNSDAEFASRLQANFSPMFPEVGRVRFAVHYRAHGAVGSDCCDAIRLDERHVGFWLADTMTRGVPAALLTAFLRRAITGKEIGSRGYRIVPPGEVLTRLNRDLLALQLPEPPLATIIYGVIDSETGEVTLARAAHPLPLRAPADEPPCVWHLAGSLLGVIGASYDSDTRTLNANERLIMVTDGLCKEPASACHPELLDVLSTIPSDSLDNYVRSFAQAVAGERILTDDATVLALEYRAE